MIDLDASVPILVAHPKGKPVQRLSSITNAIRSLAHDVDRLFSFLQ